MLYLEPNEVQLVNKDCCSNQKKRLPYGELGNVSMSTSCGCCAAFNGGGLAGTVEGQEGAISPGCGCEKELVHTIVEELNKRQRARGDVAQIKRADEAAQNMKVLGAKVDMLDAKIDAILAHLKIPEPVAMVR